MNSRLSKLCVQRGDTIVCAQDVHLNCAMTTGAKGTRQTKGAQRIGRQKERKEKHATLLQKVHREHYQWTKGANGPRVLSSSHVPSSLLNSGHQTSPPRFFAHRRAAGTWTKQRRPVAWLVEGQHLFYQPRQYLWTAVASDGTLDLVMKAQTSCRFSERSAPIL